MPNDMKHPFSIIKPHHQLMIQLLGNMLLSLLTNPQINILLQDLLRLSVDFIVIVEVIQLQLEGSGDCPLWMENCAFWLFYWEEGWEGDGDADGGVVVLFHLGNYGFGEVLDQVLGEHVLAWVLVEQVPVLWSLVLWLVGQCVCSAFSQVNVPEVVLDLL